MSKWKTVRLGDVCEIAAGQGAPQGDSNYCDEGTPFVKAGNLIELIEGKSEKQIQKVSEEVAKSHKLKKYKASSILFAKSGMSCMKGYVYQLKNDCYVVSHLAIVKPKEDFSDYIEYCLRHIKPNTLVKDEAYPSISLQDISNLQIPLPPLETQKQIAAVLDKCTSLISKYKQILKKYDTLIKSRFIEMFDNYQNSECQTLETLCSIITDGTHQPPKFTTTGIPFLFVSNIAGNKLTYETEKFISEETYKELYKRTPIEIGDILLSTVGSYGHPAIVENDKKFLFQRHIAYLKPKKDFINSVYFHGALLSPDVQKQIEERVKGIAQKTLNLSEIRKITIPVPPIELQNDFAAFVQQIDKSKFAVQKSLEKAETLYKSLMQEYFG